MSLFVFISLYIISITAPALLHLVLSGSEVTDKVVVFGGVLGCLAFSVMCNQLILASRPRAVETLLGLQKLNRVQLRASFAAVVLILIHKVIKEQYFGPTLQSLLGDNALVLSLLVLMVASIFLFRTRFESLPLYLLIRRAAAKLLLFGYEQAKFLYHIQAVALGILLFHVLLARNGFSSLPVKIILSIQGIAALVIYIRHVIRQRLASQRHPLVVRWVRQPVPGIVEFAIAPMREDSVNRRDFQAGQFALLAIDNPAIPYEFHPFSVADYDDHDNSYRFIVKQCGDFTRTLAGLKPDNRVFVEGFFGSFGKVLEQFSGPFIMLAGGIGITPLLAMVKSLSRKTNPPVVHLRWSVKTEDEAFLRTELSEAFQAMPGSTFALYCTRETGGSMSGRFSRRNLEELVASAQPDKLDSAWLVCGPDRMNRLVTSTLRLLGVPKERLFREQFRL